MKFLSTLMLLLTLTTTFVSTNDAIAGGHYRTVTRTRFVTRSCYRPRPCYPRGCWGRRAHRRCYRPRRPWGFNLTIGGPGGFLNLGFGGFA